MTQAGLACPSTSKVTSNFPWMPPAISVASASRTETRMREPTGTGAGNRSLIDPVVDAGAQVGDLEDLGHQRDDQRQGQVSVGDRRSERASRRNVGIDVDRIVVPGQVRESVHLVLGDRMPARCAEFRADERRDAGNGGSRGGGGCFNGHGLLLAVGNSRTLSGLLRIRMLLADDFLRARRLARSIDFFNHRFYGVASCGMIPLTGRCGRVVPGCPDYGKGCGADAESGTGLVDLPAAGEIRRTRRP